MFVDTHVEYQPLTSAKLSGGLSFPLPHHIPSSFIESTHSLPCCPPIFQSRLNTLTVGAGPKWRSLFPLTLYLPHLLSGKSQTARQPGDSCSLKWLGQCPRELDRACGGGRRPWWGLGRLLCVVSHPQQALPQRGLKAKEMGT